MPVIAATASPAPPTGPLVPRRLAAEIDRCRREVDESLTILVEAEGDAVLARLGHGPAHLGAIAARVRAGVRLVSGIVAILALTVVATWTGVAAGSTGAVLPAVGLTLVAAAMARVACVQGSAHAFVGAGADLRDETAFGLWIGSRTLYVGSADAISPLAREIPYDRLGRLTASCGDVLLLDRWGGEVARLRGVDPASPGLAVLRDRIEGVRLAA